MSKRVTVTLDDDLLFNLRKIQVAQLKKLNKFISFSHVVNETLRKGL